ncbi:hypothetical protein ABXV23_20005 [Vibrio owensii]
MMADIASINALLGSIKAASDIAKLIKDSGSTLEQAEFKLQTAELISALADAKVEAADLQLELVSRNQKIQELEELLVQRESVIWEKPYYFTENEKGKDGPFCAQCYDNSDKLIRLQGGDRGIWGCHTCNITVYDCTYVKPKPRSSRGLVI